MAANKVPGIRAALCYDKASARNGREHNDSNVLTLGARLLTQTQAEEVLRTWLETPFAGGRHQARVDKIMRIEQQLVDGEGWGWVVTVEFQARGRQWIFVRPYAQIFGSAPRYRVYDQIAIRYDANNPERVAFDEWRGYVGASVATGIIGIILASQLH